MAGLTDSRVADTLLHPVRLRIVQALVGRQLTTQQLKDELSDVAQASLYRHVARLVDAGLLHVTDERSSGAGSNAPTRWSSPPSSWDRTRSHPPRSTITCGTSPPSSGSLLTGFERYLRSIGADDRARTRSASSYEQIPLWLTDDELVEADGQMDRAPRTAPRQRARRRAAPHAALADAVPGRTQSLSRLERVT